MLDSYHVDNSENVKQTRNNLNRYKSDSYSIVNPEGGSVQPGCINEKGFKPRRLDRAVTSEEGSRRTEVALETSGEVAPATTVVSKHSPRKICTTRTQIKLCYQL